MPTDEKSFAELLHKRLSRRDVIRASALAAVGLIFTTPNIESIKSMPTVKQSCCLVDPSPSPPPPPNPDCPSPALLTQPEYMGAPPPAACAWSEWRIEGGPNLEMRDATRLGGGAWFDFQTGTSSGGYGQWRIRATSMGTMVCWIKVTLVRVPSTTFYRWYEVHCQNGYIFILRMN